MLGFRPFSISEHAGYRFGFNGMEKDDEVTNSNGNSYTTPFRQLDPRLGGRWWSRDPIVKPWESPYAGFANNPIYYKDPSGLDGEGPKPKRGNGKKADKRQREKAPGQGREVDPTTDGPANSLHPGTDPPVYSGGQKPTVIVEERRPNLSPTEKAKAKVKYGIQLWRMFDEYMKSVPDWNIKGTSDGGMHGDGSNTNMDGWQIVDDNVKETGQYGAAIKGRIYYNGMPIFDYSGVQPGALVGAIGSVGPSREPWKKVDLDDLIDEDAVEFTFAIAELFGEVVDMTVDDRPIIRGVSAQAIANEMNTNARGIHTGSVRVVVNSNGDTLLTGIDKSGGSIEETVKKELE